MRDTFKGLCSIFLLSAVSKIAVMILQVVANLFNPCCLNQSLDVLAGNDGCSTISGELSVNWDPSTILSSVSNGMVAKARLSTLCNTNIKVLLPSSI